MEKSPITEETLMMLVEKAPLDDTEKSKLMKEIPDMDYGQRLMLLKTIKDIFLLDEEEKRQIEKIERLL